MKRIKYAQTEKTSILPITIYTACRTDTSKQYHWSENVNYGVVTRFVIIVALKKNLKDCNILDIVIKWEQDDSMGMIAYYEWVTADKKKTGNNAKTNIKQLSGCSPKRYPG